MFFYGRHFGDNDSFWTRNRQAISRNKKCSCNNELLESCKILQFQEITLCESKGSEWCRIYQLLHKPY